MTIGEYIKERQPHMLSVIMRIYCLGPYEGMEPPELVQKMHTVEGPNQFFKRLMEETPGFYRDERLCAGEVDRKNPPV